MLQIESDFKSLNFWFLFMITNTRHKEMIQYLAYGVRYAANASWIALASKCAYTNQHHHAATVR